MSVPLTSGDDDDREDKPAPPAPGQPDHFQLLEALQKALEAARPDATNAAPASNAGADIPTPTSEPPSPLLAPEPEETAPRPQAAPRYVGPPAPPWLRKSPPFIPLDGGPEGRAVAMRRATAPARSEPPRAARPSLLLPGVMPSGRSQPSRDPRSADGLARRRPHVESEDQLEKIFQRLTQRPPATAEEVQDVARPRRRWLARTGQFMLASVLFGGIAFFLMQFLGSRPSGSAQEHGQTTRAALVGTPAGAGAAKKSSRLIMSALSGVANRPIALGVNVEAPPPGAAIVIRGMPNGSRVTAGSQSGHGEWRVPIRDLVHAAVVPPADFVGPMSLSVDLRLSDGTVADSDVQQLKWTASAPDAVAAKPVKTTVVNTAASSPFPPPQMQPPQPEQAVAVAPTTVGSAPSTGEPRMQPPAQQPTQPPAAPAAAGVRQLDREEIANLLQRGQTMMENGDISAARLLLQRAAEAGDSQAALVLGATYDPAILKQMGTLGANADVVKAQAWYQRASEEGSDEAKQRLRQLLVQQQSR